jgi:hypothetical protein
MKKPTKSPGLSMGLWFSKGEDGGMSGHPSRFQFPGGME